MKKFVLAVALLTAVVNVHAKKSVTTEVIERIEEKIQAATEKAPAGTLSEVAFSPDAGSEGLVAKVIHASQKSIRLAAYSFTSPAIVRALLDAKKRSVDVRVLVDDRGNRASKSVAALNLLVNAGIPTRRISTYAIHHDKYIIADGAHVQTGSFNYSQAAAKSNSENVLVIWNTPQLAASYLQHWQNRFDQGVEVKSTY